MLADYDVVWFEEALPPDDLEGFIELRRHSPVPIATGEVLTRRQSFRPFIERHAVDIIQPDCTKCGGLTEAWRIAWMAYEHNIQLRAARLEHRHRPGRRPAPGGRDAGGPLRRVPDAVAVHRRADHRPVQARRGGLPAGPDQPGLGIELNRKALRRFGK